jgi:hypothetical protein
MNDAAKSLDLNTIDTVRAANEGVEVELYHPGTNANLGIKIRILGKDSEQFRRIFAEQNRKRIKRMSKGGTFKVDVLTPEEMESDLIMLLAACTTGWSGVIVDGKELDCNRENAAALYTRFPWIKEQVDNSVGDRSLFTKG